MFPNILRQSEYRYILLQKFPRTWILSLSMIAQIPHRAFGPLPAVTYQSELLAGGEHHGFTLISFPTSFKALNGMCFKSYCYIFLCVPPHNVREPRLEVILSMQSVVQNMYTVGLWNDTSQHLVSVTHIHIYTSALSPRISSQKNLLYSYFRHTAKQQTTCLSPAASTLSRPLKETAPSDVHT